MTVSDSAFSRRISEVLGVAHPVDRAEAGAVRLAAVDLPRRHRADA